MKFGRHEKLFLCEWNDTQYEVHSYFTLWEQYKRTNLFEDEFEEHFGESLEDVLHSMPLDDSRTFDNMTVKRIR